MARVDESVLDRVRFHDHSAPTMKSSTFLETLRSERTPLALLGLLAISLRVFIIVFAFSNSTAVAGGLPGFICAPSKALASGPLSQDQNGSKRACSILCCTWSDQPSKLPDFMLGQIVEERLRSPFRQPVAHNTDCAITAHFSIRAPPGSLT